MPTLCIIPLFLSMTFKMLVGSEYHPVSQINSLSGWFVFFILYFDIPEQKLELFEVFSVVDVTVKNDNSGRVYIGISHCHLWKLILIINTLKHVHFTSRNNNARFNYYIHGFSISSTFANFDIIVSNLARDALYLWMFIVCLYEIYIK